VRLVWGVLIRPIDVQRLRGTRTRPTLATPCRRLKVQRHWDVRDLRGIGDRSPYVPIDRVGDRSRCPDYAPGVPLGHVDA